MPRGGKRTGTPGKAYAARTDLHALAATTAPGQEYGQETAQRAAQQAMPMGNGDLNAAGAGGQPPAVPQVGGPPPVTGLPPGIPAPGTMPPLSAPTDRPDEHLMTGVPAGPGPGPEALTPLMQHPLITGVAALNVLGGNVSPQVKALRDAVNATLSNQAAP